MALLLYPFFVLCMTLSFVSATKSEILNTSNATQPTVSQQYNSSSVVTNATHTFKSAGDDTKSTQPPPGSGLTTLAFGVMSFILMLIVVMVILVTAVNFRGRCHNSKEEDVKNYGSVVSEGHISNRPERDSIMLVSMRTINTDTDTDSVRFSSIYSGGFDNEDQQL